MTHDPLARATELLRAGVSDTGDTNAVPLRRDEAIAKLGEALRARARQQRRRRMLGAFAVAAGVLAVLSVGGVVASRRGPQNGAMAATDLGRVREPAGAVTAVRDGRSEELGTGTRVAEGTELRTPEAAEAHLDFDTGTQITIGGASRVRLVEQSRTKRFSLEAGSIFAKVAKLREGERFVVATSDAEVEVRGTAFRVSLVAAEASCGGGTPTRLDVTEGTVVVRHAGVETRVTAGERWPTCAGPAARGAHANRADEILAGGAATAAGGADRAASTSQHGGAAPAHAGAGVAHHAHATPAAAASSHLAEQNDLFEQAMRAKREGRSSAAVSTLERLLAQYPGGPLSESASAERMRLLSTMDRSRAAGAAREYLKRWPQGGARADAERLAAGAP